jgi:hypothetical protein
MTACPSENLVGRTRFELVTNGLKVRGQPLFQRALIPKHCRALPLLKWHNLLKIKGLRHRSGSRPILSKPAIR